MTNLYEFKPPDQPSVDYAKTSNSVFLAGGITGCPNWQKTVLTDLFITKFFNRGFEKNLVVFNPRRDDFDVSDPNMPKEQIEWEFKYLHSCKYISFWFPEETLCPITLFELGAALERPNSNLIIGCHPNYKRAFDVKEQVRLIRPELNIVDSLDRLAAAIVRI